MKYNVCGSMTTDIISIIETYTAGYNNRLSTVESEVSKLKQVLFTVVQAATGLDTPPPQLPQAEPPLLLPIALSHFALDPHQRARWADVYSRLVVEKKIKPCEVSSANFTYLLCGEGTPAAAPIRWYGTTRELAYMVRRYLNSRWDVALVAFNDKKGRELPKTFRNTNAPNADSMKTIDQIFRIKS